MIILVHEIVSTPILSPGISPEAYIRAVSQIPLLSADSERSLARDFCEKGDLDAARQLVMANLRFVVYVAKSYSGYGLSESDLIQEGNLGLMKAIKRFDPEYGVRLVSYAVHWIKAEIHEYILKNWRIVKIATTKSQRKLFFNLRRVKKNLDSLTESEILKVAKDFNVSPTEVKNMEGRLSNKDEVFEAQGEQLLSPAGFLSDSSNDPATIIENNDHEIAQREKLAKAFSALEERSREIIRRRWLSEPKVTLSDLAGEFGISAERVRQLEQNALKRIRENF
ncbi:MAG: RNA polymerase sigma factor RpoH [Gammaproteobacteria bacterium]|nr:RNA polymerase sigma factor RpoH [Gammaproteobacteria bacterium]|tara:strand:- start:184 stop:1026 length:843 start_codon:yes stop_codon:yes gene_type:complete